MSKRIAIIGAGISGLVTAYALERRGHDVTIFEANDRAGGPIHTVEHQGYRFETGPHTLLVRNRAVVDLLDELDLLDDAVDANEAADTRFIVRNGRPEPLPMSPGALATTPLLSPPARLRLLAEPFIPGADDDEIDEPLASFVERRLGREVLDYFVDPFVGGIWAGDPRQLSAKHTFTPLVDFEESAGSIAAGAIRQRLLDNGDSRDKVERRLISFQGGMDTIIDRLVERIDAEVQFDSPVRKLRRDDGQWRVIYQRGKGRRGASVDAVVSTIPPYAFGELEWQHIDVPTDAVDELAGMPYAPCCVVNFGFDRSQVGHDLDGFGVLIPRVEHFHTLGALFVSTMFDATAPDGHVNITAFVGGARQPELTAEDDDTVLEMARLDLRRLLDATGAPTVTHLTRWERAIPQYEVGHGVFLERIEQLEDRLPHFYFAGNYRDGIGVPDLLESAPEHAQRIDRSLTT